MGSVLVIGSTDISAKDELLLRALVRVLDGGIGTPLRFSEHLPDCNVVFVPRHWPHRLAAHCVTVRVGEGDDAPHPSGNELAVSPPLRMTNVLAVLQSAAQRTFHDTQPDDPMRALSLLFGWISKGLQTHERRRAVVPLGAGQQAIFDYAQQRLHTSMPIDTLLGGHYSVGTPHRVSPVEEEVIRSVPQHALRPLVWQLAQRLAEGGAAPVPRPGRFRLRRWPEAAGLGAAGHPRLAALWTHSAMSLDEICRSSALPSATARWFLEACLALGLAVEESAEPRIAPQPPNPNTTPVQHPAPAAGWLSHLRERLKLW